MGDGLPPRKAEILTGASRSLETTTRINLLIVSSTLHIGGAEQVASCLASRLSQERFDVTACYLKEDGIVGEQMLRAGVDLVPIPDLRPGGRDYLSSLKLRRLIQDRKIRIIHTHDAHGLFDGSLCRVTTSGLKHVHTFHSGKYPAPRHRHRLERTLWRIPDALVAVGRAQSAVIRKTYGIPENRIRVVWNGVSEPSSQVDSAILDGTFASGAPIIASVSTLIEQKGLNFLLDAAALLHKSGERFVLLIAGEGRLRQDLEAQSSRLGLSSCVRFLGWVPQACDRLLPRCDIFVQPSNWEAMSIVVLEAMAAAKPMVVTAVGDNPHVVLPGKTGLLVHPADPMALAEKLRLLIRSPTLRAKLGQNARLRYEQYFTNQHMVAAYERLYSQVVGKNDLGTSDFAGEIF